MKKKNNENNTIKSDSKRLVGVSQEREPITPSN